MPFFEAQLCAAQSDPDDEYHRVWTKLQGEALAESPPAELRPAKQHTGWRDPFLVEAPTKENGMYASFWVHIPPLVLPVFGHRAHCRMHAGNPGMGTTALGAIEECASVCLQQRTPCYTLAI